MTVAGALCFFVLYAVTICASLRWACTRDAREDIDNHQSDQPGSHHEEGDNAAAQ